MCPRGWGEGRWYVAFDARLVHNLIDLVRSGARLCGGGGKIKDLSGQAADFAHAFDFFGGEDGDLAHAVAHGPFRAGDAVAGIIGAGDGFGELAGGGEGVVGAEATGVGEVREGVVVAGFCGREWGWRGTERREEGGELTGASFVDCFVLRLRESVDDLRTGGEAVYPGGLEAFLRAEEGLLVAEFETGRALETAGGFGAGDTCAVIRFEAHLRCHYSDDDRSGRFWRRCRWEVGVVGEEVGVGTRRLYAGQRKSAENGSTLSA